MLYWRNKMYFLLEAMTETTEEPSTGIMQNPEETVKKANELVQHLKDFLPSIISFGINVIIALVIYWVGRIIIKLLLKIIKKFFDRTKLEISVSRFLLSLIKTVLHVILILVVLDTVGIKTTSFIAVLGTAGLAIGLALQGSLSNFAGGVLILLLKPFKVGDYIIEQSGGKEGTVSKIDLFYTTLITVDNKITVIPNGILSNSSLTNVTALDTRRVDFQVGISYDSDISKAKEVMENAARENELVLKDKEIFVFVSDLDSSQVTMGLRVWTNTSDYWTVKFALTEDIKNKLDKNGIEIPFNQLVVHMDKEDKNQ